MYSYEDIFTALRGYVMRLLTSEEERIHLFNKGFNSELLVLSFHMTLQDRALQGQHTLLWKWRG